MKILFLSTSSNNVHTVIGSLESLGKHEVAAFHYDHRWHEQVAAAVQANPDVRNQLQAGLFHLPPERANCDAEMLSVAKNFSPDMMIYISAWVGDFVPTNETLGQLNSIAPLVHMCFDASDPPWWPQLRTFEEQGVFSLTVNIDGGEMWPGGRAWRGQGMDWAMNDKSITLLTPIDPRHFDGNQPDYLERPYAVGYAGNAGGWTRSALVQRLQNSVKGFAHKPRDDHPSSYRNYADFLKHCRVSISIPFTGSGAARHVKGRIVESGYAGACLLEWKNDATARWFTPRADYWEYSSIEECIEMSEWLAGHPRLTQEMATNLNRRMLTEHSPEKFWDTVIQKVIK